MWEPTSQPVDTSRRAEELKERAKQIKSLSKLSKDETLRLRLKHVGPSVALFFQDDPLKMVKGSGQFLYDDLGNEYLDCINNVAHVGHGNERVAEAVANQLHLINTNSRFLHDNLSAYAQRLVAHFPAHLSVCYLVNSGSEANDLAIRLARAYTGRKDICSVDGAYHGNLTSTMAISPYKTDKLVTGGARGYKPAKWAHVAPLPCAYRGQFSNTDDDVGDDDQKSEETTATTTAGAQQDDPERLGRLYAQAAFQVIEEAQSRGRQVAALFVESMISCGGQFPLPSGYLRHLQRLLHANGSLLVCDEVQTGFGRSGARWWAFQLDGDDIRPDIVTLGKPMGNGFPISAVVTTPEIGRAFQQIGTEYFNTFGGNAASCAAALAVLDQLEDGQLMGQARRVGDYLLRELGALQRKSRVIGDVRGLGYFIGLELVEDRASRRPAPRYAQFVVARFRQERVLISTEGKLGNVLKFKPPMVFDMDDARRLVELMARTIGELELQLATNDQQQQPQSRQQSCGSSCSSSSSVSSSSWLESSSELE